ncbi:hypothetical protein [Roseiflexus castenholzii]|uniref:hypothetical protein n=1 Tax=Roseiflexus castenholzii TaxID=120962 RepID=UPI003C7B3A82
MHKRIFFLFILLALSMSFTPALRAQTDAPPNIRQTNDLSSTSVPAETPADFTVYLPFVRVPPVPVATVLKPFDVNASDLVGPASWDANYGKRPEIIVAAQGSTLHILAQDYDPNTAWNAALLRLEPADGGYQITQALTRLPMLDRIMGLAVDDAGNRYYATCVDEAHLVNPYYPPPGYRSNIVRVIKVSPAGEALFNIDLDVARHDAPIINPMTASSARLAFGGNHIALVHGGNTSPDWSIEGQRHQISLFTEIDAVSGAIIKTQGVWTSHAFDQRLLFDGTRILQLHLGDAYPRAIVLGRGFYEDSNIFAIKGSIGENLTATRLGNIALIEQDPTYKYLVLFATETSDQTGNIFDSKINGPRNLAIVRVRGDNFSVDPALPDILTVESGGVVVTNRLRWLTNYSAESRLHAERPKMIGIGNDRYIVLWEEWRNVNQETDVFNGVYGMLIDAQGSILIPAKLLTTSHLPRGDDAVFFQNGAAWVTGDAARRNLSIHLVDATLQYRVVTID